MNVAAGAVVIPADALSAADAGIAGTRQAYMFREPGGVRLAGFSAVAEFVSVAMAGFDSRLSIKIFMPSPRVLLRFCAYASCGAVWQGQGS
jgi:hypothetical protein